MELFIFWLAFSLIPAIVASKKGRSGFGWFCLSALISPILALLFVLIVSPIEANVEEAKLSSGENQKCPECAELVKAEAIKCRFCGAALGVSKESDDTPTEDTFIGDGSD
jgi:hypothetical protein